MSYHHRCLTVASHSRFARHPGRNEHNLGALQTRRHAACHVRCIPGNLRHIIFSHRTSSTSGRSAHTTLLVLMWPTSAATPGAPLMSNSASSLTAGFSLRRRESGCPIPPPAPRIATLVAWRVFLSAGNGPTTLQRGDRKTHVAGCGGEGPLGGDSVDGTRELASDKHDDGRFGGEMKWLCVLMCGRMSNHSEFGEEADERALLTPQAAASKTSPLESALPASLLAIHKPVLVEATRPAVILWRSADRAGRTS